MMGRREDGQGQFFYAFDLDKVAPPSVKMNSRRRIWIAMRPLPPEVVCMQ